MAANPNYDDDYEGAFTEEKWAWDEVSDEVDDIASDYRDKEFKLREMQGEIEDNDYFKDSDDFEPQDASQIESLTKNIEQGSSILRQYKPIVESLQKKEVEIYKKLTAVMRTAIDEFKKEVEAARDKIDRIWGG
jgi:hypothetical protein